MKRKRNAVEILISSDSEYEEQADTEEENDDDDDEDDNDDIDDDDDDDDDEEDDNDDIDDNDDDDDDAYDDDEDQDAYDDDDDDDNDDDENALSRVFERVPARKSQKRAFPGFDGDRHIKSSKEGKKKTRHKKRRKKGGGHAMSEEDHKLFPEALDIIRGGDLEKLKLEHCKAYLRRYSLRLTGSKTTLVDRVQEHFELKARGGGMAKYPQSTFTINCTGDACTGDVVLFKQKVKNSYKKAGASSTKPSWGRRIVAGRIVKESYGSDKQQHTFTVEVLWSRGPKQLPLLYPLLIKGRNLYRLATYRQRWPNEEERKRVLQEKHSRGDVARNAREDRVSGKRHSCSSRMRLSNRKARVTLKREQRSVNFSQVNTNAGKPGSSREKARSDSQSKETALREGSINSRVVSSHREYENRFYETCGTTKCMLSIKACFAGLLIGSKGRNIGAISRASGARLQICEDNLNPTSRLVEIIGVPEQVQVATGMVMQSFSDRGLPSPVVTMQSSGFTGQGWPPYDVLPVPAHNAFMPHDAMR